VQLHTTSRIPRETYKVNGGSNSLLSTLYFSTQNTQNSLSSAQPLPMKMYTVYKKLVAGREVQLLLNYSLGKLFVKSCYIRTVILQIKRNLFQGYLGFVRHFRSVVTYSTIARRIQGAGGPYLRTNGHTDDPSACSRVSSLWPYSTRTTHACTCPQLITF